VHLTPPGPDDRRQSARPAPPGNLVRRGEADMTGNYLVADDQVIPCLRDRDDQVIRLWRRFRDGGYPG